MCPHVKTETAAGGSGSGFQGASGQCPPKSSIVSVGGHSGQELRGEPERALALDHVIPGPEDKLPAQAIAHSGKLAWKSVPTGRIVWRARGKGQVWGITHTVPKGAKMPVLP